MSNPDRGRWARAAQECAREVDLELEGYIHQLLGARFSELDEAGAIAAGKSTSGPDLFH